MSVFNRPAFWVTVISVLTAILTFYRLGTVNEPQTIWAPTMVGQSDEVRFSQTERLDKILYYQVVGNGTFDVEAMSSDGTWKTVSHLTQGEWVTNKWLELSRPVTTSEIRVVLTSGTVRLAEMGFFNIRGQRIAPVNTSSNPLVDDQKAVPTQQTMQNSSYFDEVYYPADAFEYLHHLSVTEAVHPPFAPEIMAVSMSIFGNSPFAWRFFGATAGVLMVPLMFLVGRRVFRNDWTAFFSAFAFAITGMNLVQSRVATLDIYAAFFSLLFWYYFLRFMDQNRRIDLYVTGIALGLGIACKWNSVFVDGGGLMWLLYAGGRDRRRLLWWIEAFTGLIVVPLLVYALTFVPVFGWREMLPVPFWHLQAYMLAFQLNVGSTWFSEHWWSMLFDYKPYWYGEGPLGATSGLVSDLGNPAIWYGVVLSVPWAAWTCIRRKEERPFWILVSYLVSLIPWVFVSRLTFSYYYFVSVPLLAFVTAYAIQSAHRAVRVVSWNLASYMFLIFLPVFIAIPVPTWYLLHLKWLHTWYYF